MTTPPIRVLVLDDSAFVRKTVRQMLTRDGDIEVVATARDGEEALELAETLRPDVVTTDLIMPGMDGAEFTRQLMARRPTPIVVVSIASASHERVLAALEAGAVDFTRKPTALATDKVLEIQDELVRKVRSAAQQSAPRPLASPSTESAADELPGRLYRKSFDIVVIGISTGGPQALRSLIPRLPVDLPVPVLIVMHMPVGYTEAYARRLGELSHLKVKEAADGDLLQSGQVLLARAGYHLRISRNGAGRIAAMLDWEPASSLHRPSIDVLFRSAVDVWGGRVLGVVMTGMGADGREGAAWIKSAGGTVLTEAEDSCVVYGMPRSVVEAGLSDASCTLEAMPRAILELL